MILTFTGSSFPSCFCSKKGSFSKLPFMEVICPKTNKVDSRKKDINSFFVIKWVFLWSGLLLLSVEIERVAVYGYTESAFYGFLYRLDSWVTKLYDFLYFFL